MMEASIFTCGFEHPTSWRPARPHFETSESCRSGKCYYLPVLHTCALVLDVFRYHELASAGWEYLIYTHVLDIFYFLAVIAKHSLFHPNIHEKHRTNTATFSWWYGQHLLTLSARDYAGFLSRLCKHPF